MHRAIINTGAGDEWEGWVLESSVTIKERTSSISDIYDRKVFFLLPLQLLKTQIKKRSKCHRVFDQSDLKVFLDQINVSCSRVLCHTLQKT